MKTVLCVFGTRPEAIKMAPVVKALRSQPGVDVRVCVTGQHRSMLDSVLHAFDLKPDIDLNIMTPGQDLTDVTCRVLTALRDVLKAQKPQWVLVQGDTTSTMAGAMAAFYHNVKIGHVEAGLRTWNMHAPWPEEMNRRVSTILADLHFPPTEQAAQNLRNEGVPEERILLTGNTVIDALLSVVERVRSEEPLNREMAAKFSMLDKSRRKVLVTGHRRENFGGGFESICRAIRTLGERGDLQLIYPVHLNPNVREPVQRILGGCPNVVLLEPQDYVPFIYLMDQVDIVLTDSGGVQEEAPSLGKPVLVMRETTERPEGVDAGAVELVGCDEARIVAAVDRLMTDAGAYERMSRAVNPYGDGKASQRIAEAIGAAMGS